MNNSESEYETHSEGSSYKIDESERERKVGTGKKSYSTEGISLDHPIDYRGIGKGRTKNKEVEETSEYTEYTGDDDDDDDDSTGSISDESEEDAGKQKSDREKLQELESLLNANKKQNPVLSARHRGKYTESEEESEYLDSDETDSDGESIRGKSAKRTAKTGKQATETLGSQKGKDADVKKEESEESEVTGSETEKTDTEEDDYATFLRKQLEAQEQQIMLNTENTVQSDVNIAVDEKKESSHEENKGQYKSEEDRENLSESKEKEKRECRKGTSHSLERNTEPTGDERNAEGGTTSLASARSRSSRTRTPEKYSNSKCDFLNDDCKSKANDANGHKEQKIEMDQCENMQNMESNNSEAELKFTEAERMNDKLDKTLMTRPDHGSSDGIEKGEKSNLNSDRKINKRIEYLSDGAHAAAEESHSVKSDTSMEQHITTEKGTFEQLLKSNGSEAALRPNGGGGMDKTDQTDFGLSVMELKADLVPKSEGKMPLNETQNGTNLNIKGDSESVTSNKDESDEIRARKNSVESENFTGNHSNFSERDSETKNNNESQTGYNNENSKQETDVSLDKVNSDENRKGEVDHSSENDMQNIISENLSQENSGEYVETTNDQYETDNQCVKQNSTTSSQIDNKVIEEVTKVNIIESTSRRGSQQRAEESEAGDDDSNVSRGEYRVEEKQPQENNGDEGDNVTRKVSEDSENSLNGETNDKELDEPKLIGSGNQNYETLKDESYKVLNEEVMIQTLEEEETKSTKSSRSSLDSNAREKDNMLSTDQNNGQKDKPDDDVCQVDQNSDICDKSSMDLNVENNAQNDQRKDNAYNEHDTKDSKAQLNEEDEQIKCSDSKSDTTTEEESKHDTGIDPSSENTENSIKEIDMQQHSSDKDEGTKPKNSDGAQHVQGSRNSLDSLDKNTKEDMSSPADSLDGDNKSPDETDESYNKKSSDQTSEKQSPDARLGSSGNRTKHEHGTSYEQMSMTSMQPDLTEDSVRELLNTERGSSNYGSQHTIESSNDEKVPSRASASSYRTKRDRSPSEDKQGKSSFKDKLDVSEAEEKEYIPWDGDKEEISQSADKDDADLLQNLDKQHVLQNGDKRKRFQS